MPLYTKEQLSSKDELELHRIAEELHVDNAGSTDKETLIYAILDGQAEQNAAEQKTPKRRTRIVKKDVDHVYSASKTKTESFEKSEPKRRGRTAAAQEPVKPEAVRESNEEETVSTENNKPATVKRKQEKTAIPESQASLPFRLERCSGSRTVPHSGGTSRRAERRTCGFRRNRKSGAAERGKHRGTRARS